MTAWNATTEEALVRLEEIRWRSPLLAALLFGFSVITVAGNTLVVVAVAKKTYLQNPTGYLIVSLAASDLIVGLLVMPANALFQMANQHWMFGLALCDAWHSLDVLASTASIWNLCVIGMDRYVANRDPLSYRDCVTAGRTAAAIAAVWCLSAALSLPAIIWWRTTSPHLYLDERHCVFTDDIYYVAFSSFVSFFLPLVIIIFAYARIFIIASRHQTALKTGRKSLKLRHPTPQQKTRHSDSVVSSSAAETLSEQVKTAASRASCSTAAQQDGVLRVHVGGAAAAEERAKYRLKQLKRCTDATPPFRHSKFSEVLAASTTRLSSSETVNRKSSVPRAFRYKCGSLAGRPQQRQSSNEQFRSCRMNCLFTGKPVQGMAEQLLSADRRGARWSNTPKGRARIAVLHKSRIIVKFLQEKRAARTLSIVVGCFVICWFPFFTVNVALVVWPDCLDMETKNLLFTVFTWLGHCNSMLNPIIYSRFSREFRRAFQQILSFQSTRFPDVQAAFRAPVAFALSSIPAALRLRTVQH